MAILPVYTYDHPILRQKATPVENMTDEIQQFIDDLFETMYNADGIGIAANQVGSSHAITIMDLSVIEDDEEMKNMKPMVLVNPVIEFYSEDTVEYEEGCLSLPTLRDNVIRPAGIQVRFYDRDMKEHVMETDAMLARVMQHEIDHLNGIYFFELLSPVRRAIAHPKLKRIQRGSVSTEYPIEINKVLAKSGRK